MINTSSRHYPADHPQPPLPHEQLPPLPQPPLRALESILNGRMRFGLVGIKSFRAFDSDVVVVLVRTDHVNQLIGASLATGDPHRSAALAVLNATNRVLGNYLTNTEGE